MLENTEKVEKKTVAWAFDIKFIHVGYFSSQYAEWINWIKIIFRYTV